MDCLQIISVAISTVTMFAVIVTAIIYACQLHQMTKATEAATASAKAAEKSVAAMECTAHKQLRAYIQIHPWMLHKFSSTVPVTVDFKIHNFGQTPAKKVIFKADVFVQSSAISADYKLPIINRPWSMPMDIFPNIGDRNTLIPQETATQPFSRQVIDLLMAGKLTLYVFGELKYWDVFDKEQLVYFCTRIPDHLRVGALLVGNEPKIEISAQMAETGNSFT